MASHPHPAVPRTDAAIRIEVEEKYCEIAAKRMGQEVFQFNPT